MKLALTYPHSNAESETGRPGFPKYLLFYSLPENVAINLIYLNKYIKWKKQKDTFFNPWRSSVVAFYQNEK